MGSDPMVSRSKMKKYVYLAVLAASVMLTVHFEGDYGV